jgi:hypothetical protein
MPGKRTALARFDSLSGQAAIKTTITVRRRHDRHKLGVTPRRDAWRYSGGMNSPTTFHPRNALIAVAIAAPMQRPARSHATSDKQRPTAIALKKIDLLRGEF